MARLKKARARPKTGLAGIQGKMLTNYETCCWYFQHELDSKHYTEIMKPYIVSNFKYDAKHIFALPDWKWNIFSRWACAIYWHTNLLQTDIDENTRKQVIEEASTVNSYLKELVDLGKEVKIIKEQEKEEKEVPVERISPTKRLFDKVNRTVLADIDTVEEEWIRGSSSSIDVYNLFKKHGLKGKAVTPVRNYIEQQLQLYQDCKNKSCSQAVEALSHIDKKQITRIIKAYEQIIKDLDRIQAQSTLNRASRKPKVKTADKQIVKLNYKKTDKDFKLESVNPLLVIGAHRLYTFNTKTRVLSVYITNSTDGIHVKGTSLYNIDDTLSVCTRLRKPDEVLPTILGRADKTIDKMLKELTTKKSTPRTRINNDTILLRAV